MSARHRSQREELADLRAELRARHWTYREIAAHLRGTRGYGVLLSFRLAHGFTQEHVAGKLNETAPAETTTTITGQHICYWEAWPGGTGRQPTLNDLRRLAQVYACSIHDLIEAHDFTHLDPETESESRPSTTGTERSPREEQCRQVDGSSPLPASLNELEGAAFANPGFRVARDGSMGAVPLLPHLDAWGISASVPGVPKSTQETERLYDYLVTQFSQWADTMRRREVLHLLGWAASFAAAAPILAEIDPEEQQRVINGIATPSRIDSSALGHIEAVLWHARRQDDLLGPQAALHTVLSQRNVIRWILTDCPTPLRPQILSLHSVASRLAGWLSFDMADYKGAGHYYEEARNSAHEARNSALAAQVLCNMSHLATWQGAAHLGIDHAVAAQKWAAQTDDVPLQAYAHQVAARAYAADNSPVALRELDTAERHLALADPGHVSAVHFNDSAQLAGDRSRCHLLLDLPDQAASEAQRALELRDASFVRNRAFNTLYLGLARLAAKEVKEAATTIGDAVELAAQNRSPRFVVELRDTLDDLARSPWRDDPAVVTLRTRCIESGINQDVSGVS